MQGADLQNTSPYSQGEASGGKQWPLSAQAAARSPASRWQHTRCHLTPGPLQAALSSAAKGPRRDVTSGAEDGHHCFWAGDGATAAEGGVHKVPAPSVVSKPPQPASQATL